MSELDNIIRWIVDLEIAKDGLPLDDYKRKIKDLFTNLVKNERKWVTDDPLINALLERIAEL